MNSLRRLLQPEELNYSKLVDPVSEEQIVPVICIDQRAFAERGLAALVMQGFANRAAVEQTFETKRATFYSRSQRGLWVKGASSGNILAVRAAYTDCDYDSLLLDVNPVGPTCHTGAASCFECEP